MNFGAVSHDVAAEMAAGAVAKDRIDAAVSVTGVAGPGGGTVEKPVGLVFIGAALADKPAIAERHQFKGDRQAVRAASVAAALTMLINLIGESSSA